MRQARFRAAGTLFAKYPSRPAADDAAHEPPAPNRLEASMLSYALIFFIIAIIAAVLGFGGIAAAAAGIAKILFFVFLVLLVISLLTGRKRPA